MKIRMFCASVIALICVACGGGSSSSSSDVANPVGQDPASTPTRYSGPGSRWDVVLNPDSSFTIERRESMTAPVSLTVNGVYSEQANGFMSLVVSDATGDGAPSAGAEAWGIEIPGFAYFLKPAGSSSEFISMVMAGECPTNDFVGNWIIMKSRDDADATDADQEFFGVFSYDIETGQASLPAQHALVDGFPGGVNVDLDQGVCAEGMMQVDDAEMYLTRSGGALVHTNVDSDSESSIIFAMPQATLPAISDLDNEYAGLIFGSAGDTIQPVVVACAAGLCTADVLDDVELGTSIDQLQINLVGTLDFPDPGVITGTIERGGLQGNLACMANTSLAANAPVMLTCVAQDPDNPSERINVILRGRV
ncbi:MAG: hypothetical protein GKR90_25140 [Pseudomonadales bacterium]|nr:hypothetical protein [Pseudomonadales bacterium]